MAQVEQELLEEEIFIGCTHVMLHVLSITQRAVYVLGALCELEARDAAYILGTSEVAFRKRLSRARADLDAFVSRHCGVADPHNRCRCAFQVNLNIEREHLDPCSLRFALQTGKTSLQTLQAAAEVHRVRSALELFRAQPELCSPEPFAESVRALLAQTRFLSATHV